MKRVFLRYAHGAMSLVALPGRGRRTLVGQHPSGGNFEAGGAARGLSRSDLGGHTHYRGVLGAPDQMLLYGLEA